MGTDINVHDQWACESMGAIADRSREHLGQSDKAITAYRRLLRSAIEAAGNGGKPPMVLDAAAAAKITGPAAIDGIGPSDDWQRYWQETDRARRARASWAAPSPTPDGIILPPFSPAFPCFSGINRPPPAWPAAAV